jgi:hypothetical protein
MDTRNPYLFTGEIETTWFNPDAFDPWMHKTRHPELPAGLNSVCVNGDELNGSGVNEPIWPFYWSNWDGIYPIVFPKDYLNVFTTTCPDLTIRGVFNKVRIPPPSPTLCIKAKD